jgi:hypothetical protein
MGHLYSGAKFLVADTFLISHSFAAGHYYSRIIVSTHLGICQGLLLYGTSYLGNSVCALEHLHHVLGDGEVEVTSELRSLNTCHTRACFTAGHTGPNIQGAPRVKVTTSGECSLC